MEELGESVVTEHDQVSGQTELNQINKDYQKTLSIFPPDIRQRKEQSITGAFQEFGRRLANEENFNFGERQQAILKLKLARHFQREAKIDANTLYDAIVENPKFIDTEKGSLHRLFEVHEVKTLQRIAEVRKRRTEAGDNNVLNPYENLFITKSGNYYMARLLNMPHLEAESAYMKHCVGTSDSYIYQMKRGDIEILSFRSASKFNSKTQKLEGDTPIMTIEYNLRTKVIEQMKKQDEKHLSPDDPYYEDVIDALKQLRTTRTDSGKQRDFVKISPSELENIKVKDYHILTENGQVSFRNFNPGTGTFILKTGEMPITQGTSHQDVARIVRLIEGISCKPDEIAQSREQVASKTRVYIGKPFPGFFKWLPDHIQHIYTSFPTSFSEGKITRETVLAGGRTAKELERSLRQKGINFGSYAEQMMESPDFVTLKRSEQINLIRFKVCSLGFTQDPTIDQIYQEAQRLGLELCPQEVGPELRLKYENQPLYESFYIGMKQITTSGGAPFVFLLYRLADGAWLDDDWAGPSRRWDLGTEFVFRLRK